MKLLALNCPVCGQRLLPKSRDVLVMGCGNCGTAVSIDPDKGIEQTTVQFAQTGSESVEAWVPLWVFDAQVKIKSRQTRQRDGRSEKASQALWGTPRRLFVPAWTLNMKVARQLGTKMVEKQPQLQAIEKPDGVQMAEAVVAQEDALKLLEFIVLSIEADRKDWLTNLQFDIETRSTELWVVAAQKRGNGWRLLI